MGKIRKISQNELMYMDMQDLTTTSFAIQYVVEYEEKIEPVLLRKAVMAAIESLKGSCVKKKGGWWVLSEKYPLIDIITTESEDIFSLDILNNKLNYNNESIGISIIQTPWKNFILFRFFHSVFDGKGALLFLDNVFAYINGRTGIECDNSENDETFTQKLELKNININFLKKHHLKSHQGDYGRIKWEVFNFDGYHQGMIAKLAKILNIVFQEETVSYMIPVDIRRHKRENNYLGNLTLPVFIDVKNGDFWQDINGRLLFELKNKNELNQRSIKHFHYGYIPSLLRKIIFKTIFSVKNKEKSFPIGAIISHLGRLNLEKLSFGRIKAKNFYSLPIQQPLAPFSIVIAEFDNKSTIALSYYDHLLNYESLRELFKNIKEEFSLPDNYSFNNTALERTGDFIDEFVKSSKKNLDKIAVYENDKTYTYSDLLSGSANLAGYLKKLNIKAGDKVIVNMERSFNCVAAILGILRTGAVFVPIDISEVENKISKIITDANAKAVITDAKFKEITSAEGYHSSFYKYLLRAEIYNIYTSGTTGTPKGVRITNENFSNYLFWAKETYITEKRLIMPFFTSLSVDLTLTSIFLPLLCGGAIKIFKEKFSGMILKKIYEDTLINVIKCTPTHLLLIQNYRSEPKERLIVGGENFPANLALKLTSFNKKIINEYGPAETTVGSTFHVFHTDDVKDAHVPVGTPISNTKIFLLDENKKIIREENKPGEIVITGQGVAAGYTNSNANNFSELKGERCYFTGDYGYIKNKILHCVGRMDSQIKINGQRLELESITKEISAFEGVMAAETLFHKQQIIAFVITSGNISQEELRNKLRKVLPLYAIPSTIRFVDAFPFLESGKIDRDALISWSHRPVPCLENKEKNKIPELIQELIKETFPEIEFNFKNSLYEIGLDSIKILMLIQKLADTYIPNVKQEDFIRDVISAADNISINIIENLIIKHGGHL